MSTMDKNKSNILYHDKYSVETKVMSWTYFIQSLKLELETKIFSEYKCLM